MDPPFRFGIEGRGGLVQDQQRSILEQGPGDGQPLALSPGQSHPVLADQGVQPLGQFPDKGHGLGMFGRLDDGLPGSGGAAVGDIGLHRVVKQYDILADVGQLIAQVPQLQFTDVLPVQQDTPFGGIIEAGQQGHQGALAAARGAHQGHGLPGLHRQVDPPEHRWVLLSIVKPYPLEMHRSPGPGQLLLAPIGLRGFVKQGKDALGRRQSPLQLLVDFGQPLDRSQHHGHGAEQGDKAPDGDLILEGLAGGHPDHHRQGHHCQQLYQGGGGLGGDGQLHMEAPYPVVDLLEATGLIILAAEYPHHLIAL